ncbi:MAG: alpha-1,6-mannosyltransferase [Neolewinella sp.]
MTTPSPKATIYAGALLLVAGVLYLGFGVDRMDFTSLFSSFLVAFGGYLLLVRKPDKGNLKMLIGLGIILRVALVFAFPLLSDDVFRFIWDGHLVAAGVNPFAELPAFYLEVENAVPGLTQELFDRLNSPGYYTIYPPVAQGVFTVAAWLSPGSWYGAAVVMKLFLLACELGSLWVMWQLFEARPQVQETVKEQGALATTRQPDNPTTRLLFYWLNPLILVEIMGNLHFEGAMVFFLLLAYYLLQRSKWVAAAAAMAASVASKLLPLMLLPLLIRRLTRLPQPPSRGGGIMDSVTRLFNKNYLLRLVRNARPFWIFSLAFGISGGLFFAPLLSEGFLAGFSSSLELYQKKFEFNASLYYLARAYGYLDVGWNQISVFGPFLARASAVGILLLALLDRRSDWASLPVGWLWAFVLYLLCATTVHPWYLSVPIMLCCFTHWRFPLVWSFLIMLTYTNYLTEPYHENLWLVSVEYLVVAGFAFWEWRRFRPKFLNKRGIM